MRDRVGEIAREVWRNLGKRKSLTFDKLTRSIKERPEVVSMAVGWLLREDQKLELSETHLNGKSVVKISLTPQEQAIYESSCGSKTNGEKQAKLQSVSHT